MLTEDRKNYIIKSYREIGDITRTSKFAHASKRTVTKCIKSVGLTKPAHGPRRYGINESFFATYTPESCYWAGFIAADGCLSMTKRGAKTICINLSKIDIKHLEKFKLSSGLTHPIYIAKNTSVAVSVSAYRWFDDLKTNFNLGPRKSLTLMPPFKLTDQDLKLHFIRGYFDGDGWLSHSKKTKQWAGGMIGTKEFLEWVKKEIGATNSIAQYSKIMTLALTGPSFRRAMFLIYNNSNEQHRLDRKYIKFQQMNASRNILLET